MEVWLGISSVGGLVVAILTVLFTYLRDKDTRSAAYRTRIYDRQFDALAELLPVLMEHYRAASVSLYVQSFDVDEHAVLGDEDWRHITSSRSGPTDELRRRWQRSTLIIPKGTSAALERYLAASGRLGEQYRTLHEAQSAVKKAYENAVQQMRRDLGTDALTEANLRAMGVVSRERDDAVRADYQRYDERMRQGAPKRPNAE